MASSKLLRLSMISTLLFVGILVGGSAGASRNRHLGRFSLHGPVKISSTSCGSNICYDIRSKDLPDEKGRPLKLSGTGMVDESTCQNVNGSTCCHTVESGKVIVRESEVDEGFVGLACINPGQTKETIRAALTITGGTKFFAGASGSGKVMAKIHTANGKGTITITGHIK